MWPLERQRSVLRVGRHRVELWRSASQGLVMHESRDFDGAGASEPGELERCLAHLLRGDVLGATRSARQVDVVLESAWLPVMGFGVGASPTTRGRVEALLKHYMGDLHEPREAFELRLEHRTGDRQALGYALAPAVKRAALAQVVAAGLQAASVQPSFAWAWSRLARHRRGLRSGWWVWSEQDRSLVAQWQRGRVVTLNAGAEPLEAEADIARAVATEAARQGQLQDLQIVHAGWSAGESWPDAQFRLIRAHVAAPIASSPTSAMAAAKLAGAA